MALSDERIWASDAIMRANAAAGLPMPILGMLCRTVVAEVRKDDEALIRQLVEALSLEVVEWEPGFLAGAYDSDEPRENVARAKILAALKAARARLEKAP
jgi:hypothetical protein